MTFGLVVTSNGHSPEGIWNVTRRTFLVVTVRPDRSFNAASIRA